MQTALVRQDLSRTHLAHHQLDSEMTIIIITINIFTVIINIIKHYHYYYNYYYCYYQY